MNPLDSRPHFTATVERLPRLLKQLVACEPISVIDRASLPNTPAIYAFFENGQPVYVGRSGKKNGLKKRIGNHTQKNHHQASFVYKLTCLELGLPRIYKAGSGGTRAERMSDPNFQNEFALRRQRLFNMQVRYVEVHDDIDQYLLELYASIEFGLDLSGFSTH